MLTKWLQKMQALSQLAQHAVPAFQAPGKPAVAFPINLFSELKYSSVQDAT